MTEAQTKQLPATIDNSLKLPIGAGALPEQKLLPALAARNIPFDTFQVLKEAVFPAAENDTSILLALDYCRARKLDPLRKPVHIVPTYSKRAGKMIETIWPSIDLYRITAHRTNQYLGSEPTEFGPEMNRTFKYKDNGREVEVNVSFPQWCQITVYRLQGGEKVAHPGPRIYWTEICSKRKDSQAPNDRWCNNPYSMIEKCAEAAALRKAFPEECNSQTSDEVEGKTIDEFDDLQIPKWREHDAIANKAQEIADRQHASMCEKLGVDAGDKHAETTKGDIIEATIQIAEAQGDTQKAEAFKEMRKVTSEQLQQITKRVLTLQWQPKDRTEFTKKEHGVEPKDLTFDQADDVIAKLDMLIAEKAQRDS